MDSSEELWLKRKALRDLKALHEEEILTSDEFLALKNKVTKQTTRTQGKRHESLWWANAAHLLDFAEREKHAKVPVKHETETGVKLGAWLQAQRRAARNGELIEERRRVLEEIGAEVPGPGSFYVPRRKPKAPETATTTATSGEAPVTTTTTPAAEEEEEKKEQEEEKDEPPPQQQEEEEQDVMTQDDDDDDDDIDEGGGGASRRRRRKQDAPHEVELNASERWDAALGQLSSFKDREGHASVPFRHCESESNGGFWLGLWLQKQRTAYRRKTLHADRKRRLEELGVVWYARETRENGKWDRACDLLRVFKDREGHARVPHKHAEADGESTFRLGLWLQKQKCLEKKGTLGAERSRKLKGVLGVIITKKGSTAPEEEEEEEEEEQGLLGAARPPPPSLDEQLAAAAAAMEAEAAAAREEAAEQQQGPAPEKEQGEDAGDKEDDTASSQQRSDDVLEEEALAALALPVEEEVDLAPEAAAAMMEDASGKKKKKKKAKKQQKRKPAATTTRGPAKRTKNL